MHIDPIIRFLSKVRRLKLKKSQVERFNTGCWLYQGGLFENGYGQFYVDGKNVQAHRYAYKVFKGKLRKNRVIDHLCRRKQCVNPEHLEQVTNKVNTNRGERANLLKMFCPKGHPYSKENTYYTKEKWRKCIACYRIKHPKLRRKATVN